jgi:drug/metabolite transporter (DMT)-like permease
MKTKHKTLISFVSPALGLLLLGFWVFTSKRPFDIEGYIILGLAILAIGFGLYFKIQRYNSERAGLNSNDELSKRIREKAAAKTFSISIYLWLFVILFLVGPEPRIKLIMAIGLMVMGLVFFLHWFYYSKIGISDENKN